ncbi:MAG: asparagine synthetase B, partial [Verrucomicrobia bacterium]|nr:asparagine synthetase B [Verrucomicrobiota bacterium]
IVAALEEPITSSSIVPMYFVCQRAREDVKVALIGQGPDEVFGGYNRHLGVHYGKYWRALPGVVSGPIGSAVRRLPRNETIKRGIHALGTRERLERYQQVFSLSPEKHIDSLFRPEVLASLGDHHSVDYWRSLEPQMKHLDDLGGFQLLEVRSSLPDELLMFADKLSMAHSLEVRVPYLDKTIVEYAQRLGSNAKVRRGQRKWLHRSVCRRFLPKAILNRKKRGFAVNVVDDWFNSKFEGQLPQMLLDRRSRMFTWLDFSSVAKLLRDHQSKRQDNHKLLFSLVMLEQWLRVAESANQTSARLAIR